MEIMAKLIFCKFRARIGPRGSKPETDKMAAWMAGWLNVHVDDPLDQTLLCSLRALGDEWKVGLDNGLLRDHQFRWTI